MKTKTNFATTSDVRNLINATVETLPKGPERDGIQTKMFNFWDNYNAGNNLPEGSDRKRFLAEAIDNKNAGLRIAQTLVNKDQKFSGVYYKVTDLISKLAKIKVGKNEMAKVEDNFYGKRVVRGIFAKAKFAMEPNLQGMKKVRDEIYALAQTHLRLSEKSTDSQKQNYEYRIATGLSSFVNRAPYGAEIGMEFKGSAYWNKKAMQLANEGAAYGVIADKLIAEALSIYNSHSKPIKNKAKFSHLSTMLDMLDYQSANDQEDLARKNIKGLAQSIGKLNPTKDEYSRYVKIAKSLGFSESQISGFARTGAKARFANGGTKTAAFLAKIDSKSKAMILENIAKNYGISAQAALAEVTDSEAENLLDYMTEPARSAASVLMQKYGSFSRIGFKDKFQNIKVLSGTPKGATESKIIKEGSYSPTEWEKIILLARKNEWTNLFFLPYSSFYDLKGKKIRSSRTGVKAFK